MGLNLMPPVLGLGGDFNLLRSYVKGFTTNWPAGCVSTYSGGLWTVTLPPGYGGFTKVMRIKPSFAAWSSNKNTFAYIWEDFYYDITPGGYIAPEQFSLRFKDRPGHLTQYLALDVGYWSDWYYIDLAPSPTDYWLPPLP